VIRRTLAVLAPVAAGQGFKDVVEFLIEEGAPVNIKEESGLTPLHWAAAGGHNDTVELSRKLGAKE